MVRLEHVNKYFFRRRRTEIHAINDTSLDLDPTLDIDGFDTAHKLVLLIRLAWGVDYPYTKMPIEGIRNLVGGPDEKYPTVIEKYGNTSSASIPIMLDEMLRDIASGHRIVHQALKPLQTHEVIH